MPDPFGFRGPAYYVTRDANGRLNRYDLRLQESAKDDFIEVLPQVMDCTVVPQYSVSHTEWRYIYLHVSLKVCYQAIGRKASKLL
jgi:hypothetical protein